MQRIRVWDLPTRVFHWALVAAVATAFATAKAGYMEAHGWAGLAVLGLVVFRLAWGVVGSTYARFATFVPGPRALLAYLRGPRADGAGHNPLGALSVLAILGVLLLQATGGLFASDDSTFYGPLASLVSRDTTDLVSILHRQGELLVIALVVLHIAAIAWHQRVQKHDLLRPMITGDKQVDDPAARDAQGGGLLAFVLALAIALAAMWVASGALLPPPPPPAALPPTPSW